MVKDKHIFDAVCGNINVTEHKHKYDKFAYHLQNKLHTGYLTESQNKIEEMPHFATNLVSYKQCISLQIDNGNKKDNSTVTVLKLFKNMKKYKFKGIVAVVNNANVYNKKVQLAAIQNGNIVSIKTYEDVAALINP